MSFYWVPAVLQGRHWKKKRKTRKRIHLMKNDINCTEVVNTLSVVEVKQNSRNWNFLILCPWIGCIAIMTFFLNSGRYLLHTVAPDIVALQHCAYVALKGVTNIMIVNEIDDARYVRFRPKGRWRRNRCLAGAHNEIECVRERRWWLSLDLFEEIWHDIAVRSDVFHRVIFCNNVSRRKLERNFIDVEYVANLCRVVVYHPL